MPPPIALLLCVIFVCVALFVDTRRTPTVSNAIWVPLIWVVLLASRSVEWWFNPIGGLRTDVEVGSETDRAILSALMLVGAIILGRRKLQWALWIEQNPWLVAFLLYCLVSSIWSDYPELSLKRWTRAIGAVMMILVILSEKDPVAAIATVVRRCAIIVIPFSALLIKYYREFGVGYNYWTGAEIIYGATTDKNALGRLCMIAGLFAVWEFFAGTKVRRTYVEILSKTIRGIIFVLAMWLLLISHSATALVCFVIGCLTLLVLGLSTLKKRARYLGTFLVVATSIAVVLSVSLDLTEAFLTLLGKDATLTNRTFIWDDLLVRVANPFVGVGYDSFWVGERLEYFVRVHKVTSAHNGYLDVYLELGVLGLLLFGFLLRSVFVRAKRLLMTGVDFGRLPMAVLLVFLAYNVTEAGWRATHLSFFVLLLVGIQPPLTRKAKKLASDGSHSRGIAKSTSRPTHFNRPASAGRNR